MSISDAALDASKGKDRVHAVRFEASRIAKDYQSATFLCQLALASVIGRPIEAYYPVRKGDGDSEREITQRNGLEIMFNSTILPRQASLADKPKVHLLRCASVPLDFLKTGTIPDTKDHFVPLVPLFPANDVTSGTVSHILSVQTTLVTDFSKSSRQCASVSPPQLSSSQPVDLESVQTIALNPRPSSSKRTQAKIDSFTQFKKPRPSKDDRPGCYAIPSQDSSPSQGPLPLAQTMEHVHLAFTPPQPLTAINQPDSDVEVTGTNEVISSTESPVAIPSLPFPNNDVGSLYKMASTISDSHKYDLLCHFWKPKFGHNFPANSRGRRFQYKWLTVFSW